MKVKLKYKVKPGCGDFNERGPRKRFECRVGEFRRRVKGGWLEGCFILDFGDGEWGCFYKDDLELVKE